MIEWYDFYIFGTLGTFISPLYFPGNPFYSTLSWLALFGVGFAVRPLGAIVFGRVGDLVGRKYAFLVTLLIMGGSTAAVGIVPTRASIGILAPWILFALRVLQGLALGGEYGGAAVYVAEHSPDNRRGYYTSFIQTTATLGLFLSLIVILVTRKVLSAQDFSAWGWRIPFLLSILLVGLSLWIRLRLRESPLFARLKQEGKTSKAPIAESLGRWSSWKVILLVLFGATAGQAVVWYTGQFYVQTFLTGQLGTTNYDMVYAIVAIALALGTPFFIFFGSLSDRIGRKPIMMAGNLLAVLTYYPLFLGLKHFSNPVNPVMLTLLVWIAVIYVTMVYGPIAAYLVEIFPAKIRYTSLSLPYHLGNGWFGGFLPFIATWMAGATKHPIAGVFYPIAVAAITFIVGTFYLTETNRISIWREVEGGAPAND